MNREQGVELIKQTRLIAIVRNVQEAHIAALTDALLNGGVRVMEITLNTPGATDMIGNLQQTHGDRMYIGAGTVLDLDDAKKAVHGGAKFLVTPNMDETVIRFAVSEGIPVFPGAMTPTEIVQAWKAGATAVKVFPGASLGIGYLKELQGPLGEVPMIAVGGVNERNVGEFLQTGCAAVGVGGALINLEQIHQGNYDWVTEKARLFLEASTKI